MFKRTVEKKYKKYIQCKRRNHVKMMIVSNKKQIIKAQA